MKEFEGYFDFHNIVDYLIIYRAKIAFYIHKNSYLDKYCNNNRFTIDDQARQKEIDFLQKLLPPRKEWSRPTSQAKRLQAGSSLDVNQRSIENRIYQVHRQFTSKEVLFLNTPLWYQNLRKFIFELRANVFQSDVYKIYAPDIFPARKPPFKPTDNERRPITKFVIEDKIVLSLANKYLTKIFDQLFLDCSFAFRSRNSFMRGPTYRDAVKQVKDFALKNGNKALYVAECDIKKFFDCVNHQSVLDKYIELKTLLESTGLHINKTAEKIFISYLDCYSFNTKVYPLNPDKSYWINRNDSTGYFKWVDEHDKDYHSGKLASTHIGIPQGGALSGLMVNILMHTLDSAICNLPGYGEDFIYVRYCDDMVIIHTDAAACKNHFDFYFRKLSDLNLIPHVPSSLKLTYCKEFWNGVKSRDVYLWSRKKNGLHPHSPWLSFLGYMINVNGHLKIRKKSLEKQLSKHDSEFKKVIKRLKEQSILDLVENYGAIMQSFETKLGSMAVGTIDVANYKNMEVKMCWGAGFKLLDNNKYARKQLRQLDLSRQQSIAKLDIYIRERIKDHPGKITVVANKESVKGEEEIIKKKNKVYIEPGYPHSFFSLLERCKSL